MSVTLAESAGFCFGVDRAVKLVMQTAEQAASTVTLGPIIHNRHVVRRLNELGVREISEIDDIPAGSTVILRSHGVSRAVQEALEQRGYPVVDATCPFVKRIHNHVMQAEQEGRIPLIFGVREHPEVQAIAGWTSTGVILESSQELVDWLDAAPERRDLPLAAVCQTTSTQNFWNSCTEILKKECTNAKIFDTICYATEIRQKEAQALAASSDCMIVVGDSSSSNTRRLAEICRQCCGNVVFVDNADELSKVSVHPATSVGITAGASTPAWIIKEVYNRMSEEILNEATVEESVVEAVQETAAVEEAAAEVAAVVEEATAEVPAAVEEATAEVPAAVEEAVAEAPAEEAPVQEAPAAEEPVAEAPASEEPAAEEPAGEESFEALLDQTFKTLSTGEKVTGTVTGISGTEIYVDLGTKHAGYIPFSEVSDDPTVKPEELFQVGQEVEVYVIRVNDAEGTVMLSKKRLDAQKNWDMIEQARDEKTVLEGYVTEDNKGGVVAMVNGIRVFIPASQTGIARGGDMSELVKQTVQLRITEVNRSRRRVVGSIRSVLAEARKAAQEKIWAEIEVGKKYQGKVKSLTSYGAFVDIGGVDGMVHVSELSWNRIKNPAEVVSVGDEIEVYVIGFDPEKKKISLGYKTEETNPWTIFSNNYQVGDIVTVKIVKLMTFGAFAEIVDGVDGLIHISQIADRRIDKPSDELTEGQEVEAKIIGIDADRKRISLSIRALLSGEDDE